MSNTQLEADWKYYSKHVDVWRDRYLSKRNSEINAVLSDPEKTPTEQFWDALDLMQSERNLLESCLGEHSRSKMELSLLLMFRHGLIMESDLACFSDEMRNRILDIRNRK